VKEKVGRSLAGIWSLVKRVCGGADKGDQGSETDNQAPNCETCDDCFADAFSVRSLGISDATALIGVAFMGLAYFEPRRDCRVEFVGIIITIPDLAMIAACGLLRPWMGTIRSDLRVLIFRSQEPGTSRDIDRKNARYKDPRSKPNCTHSMCSSSDFVLIVAAMQDLVTVVMTSDTEFHDLLARASSLPGLLQRLEELRTRHKDYTFEDVKDFDDIGIYLGFQSNGRDRIMERDRHSQKKSRK
jgi:hypothetical protein